MRSSAGAATPCAVTVPGRIEPLPAGRAPVPLNVISG